MFRENGGWYNAWNDTPESDHYLAIVTIVRPKGCPIVTIGEWMFHIKTWVLSESEIENTDKWVVTHWMPFPEPAVR